VDVKASAVTDSPSRFSRLRSAFNNPGSALDSQNHHELVEGAVKELAAERRSSAAGGQRLWSALPHL